jgi:SAM-dependent methyltransferase
VTRRAADGGLLARLQTALGSPAIYIGVQRLVGSDRLRRICLDSYLKLKPGERVLDIGCGPGYILDFMPDVDFVGFDTDPRYIDYARRKYGRRGRFHCAKFAAEHVRQLGAFDAIMLMGILHHLSDVEARDLLRLLSQGLTKKGRIVALDACFADDQSRIARWMAEHDRGEFVRTPVAYARLFAGLLICREAVVLSNVCRIPSTEIVHVLTLPR